MDSTPPPSKIKKINTPSKLRLIIAKNIFYVGLLYILPTPVSVTINECSIVSPRQSVILDSYMIKQGQTIIDI